MQSRWIKRNVDLKLLSETLESFFKDRGFLTSVQCSPGQFRIKAIPASTHSLCEDIVICIKGEPNDFLVSFEAGRRSRLFVRLGWLTSIFGGGIFLSKGMKSLEELEKIEEAFWRFLSEKIDGLTGF